MTSTLLKKISRIGAVTLLVGLSVFAQEHKWAGRTLNELEWTVHERLAALPFHGVFDTIRFEVQGKTVTLSGQVVKPNVKHYAERAVARLDGVGKVVNRIEVLPSSRRDDALRTNIYRAIYGNQPGEPRDTDAAPPVHIIVRNGFVTLEGVVNSEADRGMLLSKALGVTAHVSDNLRVSPGD